MNTDNRLYRWVKASELPIKEKSLADVVLTQMPNGAVFAYDTNRNIKGLREILSHHPDILCMEISKHSEPIAEINQELIINDVRGLAMEDDFREYNGNHCPDGFNANKFITELSSKYILIKR